MLKPADEAELAGMVRQAADRGEALEITGGGTRAAVGHPVAARRRVSLSNLSGITLYEPAALTVIARAGTPVAELESALAAEGQMLPFEPADWRVLLGSSGEPTIGGVYSAGISGPRRIAAGACRDSAIGVRFVDGSGEILKSGGRVMKNVTGYDLVKLLCGAWGTLGVVSEISLKVLPAPETVSTLVLHGLDDRQAVAALTAALASPYGVSGAAHLPGGEAKTLIRIEGFEASVAHRASALKEKLAGFGEATVESEASDALWRRVREIENFAGKDGAIWRISLKPSDAPQWVAEVSRSLDAQALYDWGGGLIWLRIPEAGDAGASTIRAALAPLGGHATLIRASDAVRKSVPVFQPEAAAVAAIAADLRSQFDPKGVLNPGRMG